MSAKDGGTCIESSDNKERHEEDGAEDTEVISMKNAKMGDID
jgi:hypothetical protein